MLLPRIAVPAAPRPVTPSDVPVARVLRVTRPTLYDWLQGREPNAANAERLRTLLRMMARAGVSGANPLNARFVRRPVGIQNPSLIDLLCEERIDEDRSCT